MKNMASLVESIENVDRGIANLNGRIRVLEQNTNAMKNFIKEGLAPNIRVLEQNMSAMKEFIKEAIFQGSWPVGNSGRPVTANALGSSVVGAEEKTVSKGFESDNSNMESKPEEMGGTGREEGGFKILKESDFNHRMMKVEYYRDLEDMTANQFRFLGKIEARDVIVFVGLSATHNFISKELVNALGIPLQRTIRQFQVHFGNRVGSAGEEVCEGVVLKTHGIEIVETFFVTDYLTIAHVVLGNQWLTTLDETTLQEMPMSLSFKWNGRTVKLEADPSLPRILEVGVMALEWIHDSFPTVID